MPTVAYIAPIPLPAQTANSIQVMRMCSALQRSGCELSLYAPVFGADAPAADIFAHYGVAEPFGFAPVSVPRIRGATHLFAVKAALHARAAADIVYTRSIEAAFYSTLAGLATVFEAHAPLGAFRRLHRWMLGRVLQSPRLLRVVVISEFLRETYSHQARNLEVIVAPDAADVRSRRAELHSGTGAFRVGYAGSLHRGRGTTLLLELAARCPWAQFDIYGGPEEAAALFRARAAPLRNITFHGPVSPARVAHLIVECDVLVAPYEAAVFTGTNRMETSRWMSPLKIFEYMAAGRPMVCSDLPAIRQVVEDGVTALLRAPDDVEGWAGALTELRNSPTLRHQLGDAAYESVRRSYSWDARARKVLSGIRI